MTRRTLFAAAMLLSTIAVAPPRRATAWGLASHRWVATRAAELTRCPALVGDKDEIADFAIEPDTVLKGRFGRVEEVRHFLDLDAYGAPPFAALPRDEAAAVRRYGRAAVDREGILPWYASALAARLGDEIARGDLATARRTAGYLAHYAADATMPLHATGNYDGQRTGQRGLHRRVEARLVDDHLPAYTALAARTGRRRPIPPERSAAALFTALEQSFDAVAPVLAADRAARHGTRVGSSVYFRRLDADLRTRLAERLGAAAALTAALWDGACGVR